MTIVGKLVAVDAAYREIGCFGMVDEETAHGGRGLDAVVVGQRDVQFPFGIQAVEDDALQRMVRTSGIAKGDPQEADPL